MRLAIALSAALFLLYWAPPASAYAWMIRHEYSGCNTCHADPSGGSLLTAYGRALGEAELPTQWSAPPPEVGAKFLFGAIPLPDSLLLGGDVRSAFIQLAPPGGAETPFKFY